MIETIVFVIGCVLGVCTVIAIQKIYDWIEGLQSKVTNLRNELSFFRMQREQWYEFQDWVRMNKKEKK